MRTSIKPHFRLAPDNSFSQIEDSKSSHILVLVVVRVSQDEFVFLLLYIYHDTDDLCILSIGRANSVVFDLGLIFGLLVLWVVYYIVCSNAD